MNTPPILTDRAALAAHRARVTDPSALFLHEEAIAEIEDRLSVVNRTFQDVAIVTGHAEIWQEAFPEADIISDTDTLPLKQGAYDLVIHAMALHWANDPVGQIIQCHRALRPDGLFQAVAFGGETLHELRDALTRAEVETIGGLSPRIAPMGEVRSMGALLQRAGLALPVADTLPLKASYKTIWHLMRDLRAMGETNALAARHRKPIKRALFERAAEIYSADYATEDRIIATYELVFLSGWAPHESQQQPLRPGSAKLSLAEALAIDDSSVED